MTKFEEPFILNVVSSVTWDRCYYLSIECNVSLLDVAI